ncbi:MAG: hypothetical protein V3U64_05570, partial [Cocleimonas sp.]
PQAGAYPNQQKSGGLSLSVQPEYKHSWDDGDKKITFSPFYRWDQQDKERTHVDIRQLDFVTSKGDWELQAGISSVYWGVTESQHLVDVINQKDAVEGLGGNAKLGQPLVRVSRFTENGSVDLFVLPYFRERTFAGEKGRFRSGLVVDSAATTFEDSKRKEKHVDYAVRWTNTFDEFDVGLHYFEGTSRDPELSPISTTALKAHYPLISQVGLDLQYTGESTIYKLESINRNFKDSSIKDYTAVVAGLEHTLPSFESGSELGLLAEYHNDSRGEVKSAPFQNDLFVGARYALNDENSSEVLAGAFVDLDNESKSLRVEASRRMGNGLKLNLEAQVFTDTDVNDPSIFFAKDDYVKVGIQKFF